MTAYAVWIQAGYSAERWIDSIWPTNQQAQRRRFRVDDSMKASGCPPLKVAVFTCEITGATMADDSAEPTIPLADTREEFTEELNDGK